MLEIEDFKRYFTQHKKEILEDYFAFLRFPTIATDPKYHGDVKKCADWLFDYLQRIGLKVEKWERNHAPVLFASNLDAGREKKTLLIYCHYDVQPIDPIDLWTSPPFEPTLRGDEVYARGAQDNKGQCFYTIAALKAYLELEKKFPINIKLIIEGEEESGSVALAELLSEKKESLRADYLIIVDSGIEDKNQPAITLGARGIITMEVTVEEGNHDLHSGMAGGIAYNPNRALVEMLAKLKNPDGSIAVDHFYDDLIPLNEEERKELSLEYDKEKFIQSFGFQPNGLENGLTPKEASWLRPTVEINGIWGGYTGQGFKTVIPAKAHAKLSCRLVPNQDPKKIARLVESFLVSHTPSGLKTTIRHYAGNGKGFRTNARSPLVRIMSESYRDVFKKPCQKILIGGSIPITVDLAKAAAAEMVLVGVGLPDDLIHAPNEHFSLERFEKGFLTICRAIELFRTSQYTN